MKKKLLDMIKRHESLTTFKKEFSAQKDVEWEEYREHAERDLEHKINCLQTNPAVQRRYSTYRLKSGTEKEWRQAMSKD